MKHQAPDFWKRLRYQLEYLGLRFAEWLVPRFPHGLLCALARFAGRLVYHLDARGRRVALSNLSCAFPGRYSERELRRIACRSYQTFARTMLELLWAPRLTEDVYRKLIKVEGREQVPGATEDGVPLIYFCMHASNFEWLSLAAPYISGRGLVLAQKLRNPLLGSVFDRLRSATGHEIIPQERAVLRMLKWLRAGGKFFMLNDLNIDPREGAVAINAFGLSMCVTPAHAAIAKKTGAALVPCACVPTDGNRYRFLMFPPLALNAEEDLRVTVQRCWDALEPVIQEHPELWLWSYKHWRFKPSSAPQGKYPFYANEAKRFDRLLTSTSATTPSPTGTETKPSE